MDGSSVEFRKSEGDSRPSVTVEDAKPGFGAAGVLDRLYVQPGADVSIDVTGSDAATYLTVSVARGPTSVTVTSPDPVLVTASEARVFGVRGGPRDADAHAYRARLKKGSVATVRGDDGFTLSVRLDPGGAAQVFPREFIPVSAVGFERQDESTGAPTSGILRQSEIAYPDFPKLDKVTFTNPDLPILSELEDFGIEELSLSAEAKGVHVRMAGAAGQIAVEARAARHDHRLTALQLLHQSSLFVTLVTMSGILCVVAYIWIEMWKMRGGVR